MSQRKKLTSEQRAAANAASKRWAARNREKVQQTYWRYKQAWRDLFKTLGRDKCSKCPYDRCAAAIDQHHLNPDDKEQESSNIFKGPITAKKLEELEKTVPLCKNCHAEEHERLRCQIN